VPTWLLILMTGYFAFLAWFSLFMHFEGKKAGDNQHRIKLLPPPPGWNRDFILDDAEFQLKPATYSDSALA
jgi:hypothetical protein